MADAPATSATREPAAPPAAVHAAVSAAQAQSFDSLLAFSDSVFTVLSLADATILYVSPNVRRIFNMSPAAVLGRSLLVCCTEEDARQTLRALISAVRAAPPHSAPATARVRRRVASASGEDVWVWAEIKLYSEGEYIYAITRDVSGEKRIEDTLRAFLQSTSHDLRTPCHGLECASQLLSQRASVAADNEAMELLNAVRASCSLLMTTINNVLDLKLLEREQPERSAHASGGAPQRRERVHSRTLFKDVLDVCRTACTKDIVWMNEGDAAAFPETLEGDPERLRQVLQNVAVVSVRWAAAFPVEAELHCCVQEADAPAGYVQMEAAFTAVGRTLTPTELSDAFELESCAGLALLVARAFARGLGGDVSITPTAAGTRFALRARLFEPGAAVPTPPPPAEEMPAAQEQPLDLAPVNEPTTAQQATAPSVELTRRMFEYLVQHGDEVFHAGVITAAGLSFTYISQPFERLGWKPESMLGRSPVEHMHPDELPMIQAAFADAMQRSAASGCAVPLGFTRRLLLPDGSYTWVHTAGCIEGSTWCLVCKSAASQIAKEAALRSLLLSVSAELRTPAQSGLAASQLLAQRASIAGDDEALFLVQAVGASCGLLLGMVSNVLSMRNMETGKLEMHPAAFDPHAALNDLLQVCRLGCSQSENIMWTNASEPLPASVTADRSFFTGVLQNLITNALKFEEGQGVFVSLSCALLSAGDVAAAAAAVDDGADAPTHVLEARVTDHGCGLTPQQCDRIFEAYEAAAAASGGGTGLGLFIARACARRAGGEVSVASAPGRGASFTLRLPVHVSPAAAADWQVAMRAHATASAAQATATGIKRQRSPEPVLLPGLAPPPAAAAAAAPVRLRCLLADDHALNLKLVKRLLEQRDFAVQTANNGKEALDALVAAYEAGLPPHIALIDMQMPVMDGPDATRAFRAWERDNLPADAPRLPVYCITANVLEEHRQACETAGMDGFITKPLRADALAQLHERAAAHAAQLAPLLARTQGAGEAQQ